MSHAGDKAEKLLSLNWPLNHRLSIAHHVEVVWFDLADAVTEVLPAAALIKDKIAPAQFAIWFLKENAVPVVNDEWTHTVS